VQYESEWVVLPIAIPNCWVVIKKGLVCRNIGKEYAKVKRSAGISLSSRFSSPFVTNDQITNAGEG
jgi:hypothetical protein